MISKKYLLFLAGIVWSIAGYNVLHIGLQAYMGYLSPVLFFGSALVFLFFQFMIFGKLVKKHTKRIKGYQEAKKWFWNFGMVYRLLLHRTGGIPVSCRAYLLLPILSLAHRNLRCNKKGDAH